MSNRETFKDHFSEHAQDYSAFRPGYPPALFEFLATLSPSKALVWDCGTGNGQAAVALAEHFEKVFATDASAEQLSHADKHPRVEYGVAPAEECPLPDHSADLVTVAQALHWFDIDKFFAEVRRVCRPGGHLAVWAYDFHSVNPAADIVLNRFQSEFVGPYWHPERVLVTAGYRNIPFPFEEVPAPKLEMTVNWDLPRLLGYLNTWSATKAFVKAKGFNPLDLLAGEFASAWGDPSTIRTVRWLLHVRIGRVG